MRIQVISVIHFAIIPLNAETQNAVDVTASRLDILTDVAISDVSRICPTKAIVPLEHGLSVFINGSNQRNHVLSVFIFQKNFDFLSGWENIRHKFIYADFFDFGELLYGDIGHHVIKDITSNTLSSIAIGEQDVVYGDIIQSSVSALQRIHVAKFGNSLLRILQHTLGEDSFGALVISWGDNLFITSHRSIQIHAFRNISQQDANGMIADLTNRIVNECGPTPGIQILLIIWNSSILILKFLKIPNLILPLLTLIECIRSDKLQNSIDSVHINFLERTLEYVSAISKQTFLSSDIITSNDRTLWNLRIHMMPGDNCTVIAEFVILIGSNSASVSQIEIHDRFALYKL